MTFLIALFARLGLPEPLQRIAAWATTIVAVIALIAVLRSCYDRKVIAEHDAEVEAAAQVARDQAADERAKDAVTNAKNEGDLHHAIDTAPVGGALSPAAHALACERLRKLGRVPAGCGPQGSGGNQADPE